jgi:hypothetical protein
MQLRIADDFRDLSVGPRLIQRLYPIAKGVSSLRPRWATATGTFTREIRTRRILTLTGRRVRPALLPRQALTMRKSLYPYLAWKWKSQKESLKQFERSARLIPAVQPLRTQPLVQDAVSLERRVATLHKKVLISTSLQFSKLQICSTED